MAVKRDVQYATRKDYQDEEQVGHRSVAERAARRGQRSDGWRLCVRWFRFGLNLFAVVFHALKTLLEVTDALAQSAADLRQSARPKHDQRHDHDDDQFWQADTEHVVVPRRRESRRT
jgi:hypothetical protein